MMKMVYKSRTPHSPASVRKKVQQEVRFFGAALRGATEQHVRVEVRDVNLLVLRLVRGVLDAHHLRAETLFPSVLNSQGCGLDTPAPTG